MAWTDNVTGDRGKWGDLRGGKLTRLGDGLDTGNEVSGIIPTFLTHISRWRVALFSKLENTEKRIGL